MQPNLKTFCIGLVAAGGLMASSVALADGAELYQKKACQTCHGADANKPLTATYPKLAGQEVGYLEEQMKDIRDGKRTNGLSAAMKALTAAVTDDEFKQIAEWVASAGSFSVDVDPGADGAKLYKEKECNTCHGKDGNSPVVSEANGNPPKIAGQNEAYMLTQMKDIRDGKRTNATSSLMKAKTEGVTDEDFTAIAKWLATAKK